MYKIDRHEVRFIRKKREKLQIIKTRIDKSIIIAESKDNYRTIGEYYEQFNAN